MIKATITTVILLGCIITTTFSQSDLQTYTPSKLLEKGKLDLKVFNNLYTQTRSADANGTKQGPNPRQTFFTSTWETYFGISKKSRINVGIIANVKSNIGGNKGATEVFKFQNQDFLASSGLTSIALSLKLSPFKKISNFSLQSSFFLPVFKENPNGFYLDKRSYVWETKFFYDKSFSNNTFQIFAELDFAYIFGEQPDPTNTGINNVERFANNSIAIPLSLFISYFPNDKTTVFANSQYYKLFDAGSNFEQNFSLVGLGIKRQLTKKLNMEVSSSYFIQGVGTGLGETYNLGLRYIL